MTRIPILLGLLLALVVTAGSNTVIQEDKAEAEGVVFDIGVMGGPPFQWSPTNSTVTVGTTIRWTATGVAPHTVTAEGCFDSRIGPCTFDSGAAPANFLRPGTPTASYEFTFNQPGVYPFFCRIHGGPGGTGQFGVIVVYEPGKGMPSGNYKASAALLATINAERTAAQTPAATPAPAPITPPSTGDGGMLGSDKLAGSLFVPLAGLAAAVSVLAVTRMVLQLRSDV